MLMSVMLDTSHSPIGPCRPLEQAPLGATLRLASMTLLISALDCGEKPGQWWWLWRGDGGAGSHCEWLKERMKVRGPRFAVYKLELG